MANSKNGTKTKLSDNDKNILLLKTSKQYAVFNTSRNIFNVFKQVFKYNDKQLWAIESSLDLDAGSGFTSLARSHRILQKQLFLKDASLPGYNILDNVADVKTWLDLYVMGRDIFLAYSKTKKQDKWDALLVLPRDELDNILDDYNMHNKTLHIKFVKERDSVIIAYPLVEFLKGLRDKYINMENE